MILKPELIRQIRKGKKTAMRVVAKRGRCSYYVGHDYPVRSGRDEKAACTITVLDIERQRLGDMTDDDVRAEGFRTILEYARYWLAVHDRQPADPDTYDCWLRRHGDTQVWVVTFERKRALELALPDKPVFLARDSSRGYTTDPSRMLHGAGEVMGLAPTTGSVARARRAADVARRQQIQEVHRLVERARTALDEAVLTGLELGPDLVALEQHVHAIEQRIRAA
ncbi:MAG: ASCH domain-containing protein [Solirubrobacteraceae bacterium]|nr:ASCH domain-containing protein [Solirubrobacteraceae bacterium]